MSEVIAMAVLSDEWGNVEPLTKVYEELEKRGYITTWAGTNKRFKSMQIIKDFYIKGHKFDKGFGIVDKDIEEHYFSRRWK